MEEKDQNSEMVAGEDSGEIYINIYIFFLFILRQRFFVLSDDGLVEGVKGRVGKREREGYFAQHKNTKRKNNLNILFFFEKIVFFLIFFKFFFYNTTSNSRI